MPLIWWLNIPFVLSRCVSNKVECLVKQLLSSGTACRRALVLPCHVLWSKNKVTVLVPSKVSHVWRPAACAISELLWFCVNHVCYLYKWLFCYCFFFLCIYSEFYLHVNLKQNPVRCNKTNLIPGCLARLTSPRCRRWLPIQQFDAHVVSCPIWLKAFAFFWVCLVSHQTNLDVCSRSLVQLLAFVCVKFYLVL